MSVTSPSGFVAAGVAAGIKASGGLDLAVVATADGAPVVAAAVFTQNLACAAPVQLSRAHLAATGGRAAAVVLNSGNANAATGQLGLDVARETCDLVAAGIGCLPEEVLVCSTGLIGIPIDAAPFRVGVPLAVSSLHADGGPAAAQAIMTTDTVRKEAAATASRVTVGGMAKGAAILAPNMATMLAVLTIDAAVEPDVLQRALQTAVDNSFNRLSVDGCTSTNDTVIVLAGGEPTADANLLTELLGEVTTSLAFQMCNDAEGATKVVRVRVSGAASDTEAAAAARKVAQSQLVKCSWYGQDPYWGRVLSELGSAGVRLDVDRVSIAYGDDVVSRGAVEIDHDRQAVSDHMRGRSIHLTCDLGVGDGSSWVLTNDLTHAYVDENMGTS